MSDDKAFPKPHTTVAILRVAPHMNVDRATALILETDNLGTLVLPMSSEAIQAVRGALNELELLLAQGTGNA